jgi:hypothetical protein
LMWLALGQCILRGREQCFPLHSIACMTKLLALTLGALLTTMHMPSLAPLLQVGLPPLVLFLRLPCQLHHPRCRRLLHLLHLLHFLLYRSLH